MKHFYPRALTLGIALLVSSLTAHAEAPTLTLTTPGEPWTISTLAENSAAKADNTHTVRIHTDQTFQTMDGFGGCFNELGWTSLQTLSADAAQKVLKDLFDPSGANFNYCRMPIGANDYALSWYSLDDTPGDYSLEHFSTARDQQFILPYIRAAMAYQPGLRIWGSDWSPPIWLKTNGAYNGGTLKMDPQSLTTYAAYLSRYVQEYRRQGINIVAVHVQNEPLYRQTYPSCFLDENQIIRFIGSYLGPRFAADKTDAEIWLGTINNGNLAYVTRILNDPVARPYIAGVGLQWDGKKVIRQVHEQYPRLPLMQTESECGNGSDDWKAAAYTWSLILHYLGNGAERYDYWNMVLDETGLSTWGWRQNALITVNRGKHQVVYNPEFYVMKHLSHFVQLKAVRIGTTGDWPDTLAFQNPDGSLVAVAANFSKQDVQIDFNFGGKLYPARLPKTSIATITFPPAAK